MLSRIKQRLHEIKIKVLRWRITRLKRSAAYYFSWARAAYKNREKLTGDFLYAISEKKQIYASQLSVRLQFIQIQN